MNAEFIEKKFELSYKFNPLSFYSMHWCYKSPNYVKLMTA
jgi:hypothetical protein